MQFIYLTIQYWRSLEAMSISSIPFFAWGYKVCILDERIEITDAALMGKFCSYSRMHFLWIFRIPLAKNSSIKSIIKKNSLNQNGTNSHPHVEIKTNGEITLAEVENTRLPKLSTVSNNQDMAELFRCVIWIYYTHFS